MHCVCVLEPWSALQWFCLHHECNKMLLNIKHKFLCLKFKAHRLSFNDHPALSVTEDCWQERFPDSPGFCSFNMFTKTEVDHSVFRRRSGVHPEYSSLVNTNTRHWPHSLTVCPSDGICILCTGFLFTFENIYDQFVKIYTDDQKPLNEPVSVYT